MNSAKKKEVKHEIGVDKLARAGLSNPGGPDSLVSL